MRITDHANIALKTQNTYRKNIHNVFALKLSLLYCIYNFSKEHSYELLQILKIIRTHNIRINDYHKFISTGFLTHLLHEALFSS